MKWKHTKIMIDVETGEVISPIYWGEYVVIKRKKEIKQLKADLVQQTWICQCRRKAQQLKLW